ncbi:MAG: hypothetical protein HUJ72_09120 [Blautia sp.]|nr:hypothetical protein [Blautia sp.]
MVKGVDVFQEYFRDYTDQYVLIGGAACSVSFEEQEINFDRTTKDLDIVLIVEAQTKEFGERFWQFIRDGRYRIRAKSNGNPQFYRFDKPEEDRFPKMIELFSRTDIPCLAGSLPEGFRNGDPVPVRPSGNEILFYTHEKIAKATGHVDV